MTKYIPSISLVQDTGEWIEKGEIGVKPALTTKKSWDAKIANIYKNRLV